MEDFFKNPTYRIAKQRIVSFFINDLYSISFVSPKYYTSQRVVSDIKTFYYKMYNPIISTKTSIVRNIRDLENCTTYYGPSKSYL